MIIFHDNYYLRYLERQWSFQTTLYVKIDIKTAKIIIFEGLNLFRCHKMFIEYATRDQ